MRLVPTVKTAIPAAGNKDQLWIPAHTIPHANARLAAK